VSRATLAAALAPDQRAHWDANGYLILPAFFSDAEVERVERCYAHAWAMLPSFAVVDILETHRRCYMSELDETEKTARFVKTNDLYLHYPDVRAVILHSRLVPILAALLGDAPALCNSLNFRRSSQQPVHVDSIYMAPRTPSRLVATWMALEDTRPDAGELFYYPGSHAIPPFVFAPDGRRTVQGTEDQARWNDYIHREIDGRGLTQATFSAKRGDVLIWHSELAHGGHRATDPEATRWSLVSHFWGADDVRRLGGDLQPLGDAWWIRRTSQPVRDVPPRMGPDDVMAAPSVVAPPPGRSGGLLDRLRKVALRRP